MLQSALWRSSKRSTLWQSVARTVSHKSALTHRPSQLLETVLDRLEVRATFDLATFGEVMTSLEAQLSAAASAAGAVSDLLIVVDPFDGLYAGGMITNGLESEYLARVVDPRSSGLTTTTLHSSQGHDGGRPTRSGRHYAAAQH